MCMDVAEHKILGGKHFLILGPESGKIWWLKKVQYARKKVSLPMDRLRDEKHKLSFHDFGNLLRPLELIPASRERVVPAEWQVRTVLGESESDSSSSTSVSAICADQRLDLANLSIQDEAALGHELDQGPTRRIQATEPFVGHQDGPICRLLTEKV